MSFHIIDRRKNQKGKSSGNRHRFVRRYKKQIKEAAKNVIIEDTIKDIADQTKRKVNIPSKDLSEPQIIHGKGGEKTIIHPGNKDFLEGDEFPRNNSGGGKSGSKASKDGEGEDNFVFEISQEEFLEYFFEDLELPNLEDKPISTIENFQYERAGFVSDGTPARLNIEQSMRKAKARRIALRSPKKEKLKELESQLLKLDEEINSLKDKNKNTDELEQQRKILLEEITRLKQRIKKVPFIDEMDLRYNNWVKNPKPTTQAVMFAIMDVSGSMDTFHKDIAKRFYLLLYLFLTRSYKKVDIVFIRHHTTAKEVDEQEFFYSRETGGTVVSSALKLTNEIIKERYDPVKWNIYVCQCSDGDNWHEDNLTVNNILRNQLLPLVQYYAYVEVVDSAAQVSDLSSTYNSIKKDFENFSTEKIFDKSKIYQVFRKIFEKEKKVINRE